jgi:hypothetical protein
VLQNSPASKQNQVDQPFQVRGNAYGHAITVGGGKYVWSSDSVKVDDTNSVILPVKEWTRCDLQFFGLRTTFTMATYAAIFDHVNSDVVCGAPIGTLLGKGVDFGPRAHPVTGNQIWEVSVKVVFLEATWNKYWREGTPNDAHPTAPAHAPGLDTPVDSGVYLYPAVAMSTLLTAAP